MTAEDNKKLILEHYESFLYRQDPDEIREQLASDFIDHELPPGMPPGPEGALQFGALLHKAFPDLRIEIQDVIAEGDRVAVRARWTGTHRGPFPPLALPATNRPFAFAGMVFWRIRDGKIAERWGVIDRAGLLQQLTEKS